MNAGKTPAEKLEELLATDIVPGFDKDAEWNEIARGLHKHREPMATFWRIGSAAAILLALGCWFLLAPGHNERTVNPGSDKPLAIQKPPRHDTTMIHQPAPVTRPLPNLVPQLVSHRKRENINIIVTTAIEKTDTSVSTLNATQVAHTDSKLRLTTKLATTGADVDRDEPLIAIKQHRAMALSILDVENEDRQYFIQEAPDKKRTPGVFGHMFSRLSTGEEVAATQKPYLLRSLLQK